ncbi:ornithine carbamoyltransferase [Pelagibacteraceae bacterium]|nr:ornithine carbamoyltransferase [Pelagibacteraceae bacterium]
MKHFIDINSFKKKEIDEIISLAKKIKKNPKKYSSSCKDKTLGLIFEKQSLRTRLSFNVGMQKLGGSVLELQSKDIGFDNKREKTEDVLNVLSQYIDCIMIRNNNHKQIVNLSKGNILPIINGLTEYSHPCQILGDFLTLQEHLKSIKNANIAWIGDYNNVLRSLIHLQNTYNFKLNLIIPKEIFKNYKKEFQQYKNKNLNHFFDPILGTKNSNCIMTDVWVSMGEKNKNKKKYFKNYTVNKKIITNAKNNVIFMHCLPAKRGQEVTSEVLDGKNSVILMQAKNRMYVQQAILIYVLKN